MSYRQSLPSDEHVDNTQGAAGLTWLETHVTQAECLSRRALEGIARWARSWTRLFPNDERNARADQTATASSTQNRDFSAANSSRYEQPEKLISCTVTVVLAIALSGWLLISALVATDGGVQSAVPSVTRAALARTLYSTSPVNGIE